MKLTYTFADADKNYSEEIDCQNESTDESYILSCLFYDWYRELLSNYKEELVKPVGYFDSSTSPLIEDFLNSVEILFYERHKDEHIHIEGIVSEDGESVAFDVEVSSMLHDFFECDIQSENGSIIIDEFIIQCVEKFIDNGIWHLGFESDSGKIVRFSKKDISFDGEKWFLGEAEVFPILWFSPPYKGPVKYWNTSFLDSKNRKVFEDILNCDKDVLYALIGEDSVSYYWIVECGMGISNISKVLGKCPIKFFKAGSVNITKKLVNDIITEGVEKMNSSEITLICSSEKVGNFHLWLTAEFFPVIDETVESVLEDLVIDGTLGEEFWELFCEFEDDVDKAVELSKKEGISVYDALLATFGHIYFKYFLGNEEKNEVVFESAKGEAAVYELLKEATGGSCK